MSFEHLKRNRGNNLDKLTKEVEKMSSSGGNNSSDDRFWSLTVDQMGNGSSIIRFLPAPDGEDVPWIRKWTHFFKGPGGYYVENDLSTIGKDDPCSEYNSELWNSTQDDEHPARKQARAQKRKQEYISNVYIVKDPAHPENEGKVFLFSYGKRIFDKLNDKMNPPESDIEAIDPFDFWEGCNFRLRAKKVDGQRNYNSSEFDSKTALLKGDDEKLEEVYGKMYSLQALIAPDQFKSYDELKARLHKVLKLDEKTTSSRKDPDEDDRDSWTPTEETPEPSKSKSEPQADSDDEDDEVGLEYFKNLANED